VAVLSEAARVLEGAGVRFDLICSSTTNKTLRALQRETSIEFLDIVDAVIGTIQRRELSTVGVLGTRHVTENTFYVKRLVDAGVDVDFTAPPTHHSVSPAKRYQSEQLMSSPQHIGDLTLPCPSGHLAISTELPSSSFRVSWTSSFPQAPQVIVPTLIPHFAQV
jgi:hypothetical protein